VPRNLGECPEAAIIRDEAGEVAGYRAVHVVLFNGWSSKAAGHAPWPAGVGRPPTRWAVSRTPHPFEIESWELA